MYKYAVNLSNLLNFMSCHLCFVISLLYEISYKYILKQVFCPHCITQNEVWDNMRKFNRAIHIASSSALVIDHWFQRFYRFQNSGSLGPFPWRHWRDSATSKAFPIIFPSGLFISVIRADVFMPSLFHLNVLLK